MDDFGAISAEDAKDFEPFVEAVYSGGSRLEQQDWLSVFKDKTHLASSLSEAAERSAALMGISLPESQLDESRGVFDVASSFLAMASKYTFSSSGRRRGAAFNRQRHDVSLY